ncbi:SMI1/KNR4 family protein [Deinococcus ficus]|uniref:SMI1/KNR4 family protein n=1 Tax=Deinococcus ficus TaxID=317577 RepID=UPI0003B40411|nr:SMI1/KNR4 family protein [Deinococcus ficus]
MFTGQLPHLTLTGSPGEAHVESGLVRARRSYGVELPASYLAFLVEVGPGDLGGFLHFPPVTALQTHRERLLPFLDADMEALLAPTGDVLVFADSVNGDMCGWSLQSLRRGGEVPVICVNDFEGREVARSFHALLERLTAGDDLFGVGALLPAYTRGPAPT